MITVEGLTYRYAGQPDDALRGLSVNVPEGSFVLVSGPTGSGKSTLAQALCGAIPHLLHGRLQGRVEVNGQDVATTPVRGLARFVGMLMQNVEWQTFTDAVDDEVAFGLENLGVAPEEMPLRVADALGAVGAGHLSGRKIDMLSTGERQRTMLAALLAMEQKVLILDEPLAYLDRRAAAELVVLLRRLAGIGRTVLVLEHRLDLLRPHVDQELHLRDGRLDESSNWNPEEELPRCPPARPGDVLLAYREVAFAWPGASASVFSDVSFEVRAGESVVMLGDNGTGKTTLLKIALGLHRPSAGQVVTIGLDAYRTKTRRLADDAALVLQNPDHQLHLPTVAEEVGWAAANPAEAARLITGLGLSGLEAKHPQSLSVGQKRRVTIAAALARRPRVLLLDEPSVGQDDESLALVLRELGASVASGGALLTATHDPRVVRALAHRTVVLEQGRLIHEDQRPLTNLIPIETPRC